MRDGSAVCLTLMGTPELEVKQYQENETIVLMLRGTTFSDSTVEWLKRVVSGYTRLPLKKLILEFGEVRHLNSLGIAFLLHARTTLHRMNADLVLANINDNVREILRRTGLLQRFTIESVSSCNPDVLI